MFITKIAKPHDLTSLTLGELLYEWHCHQSHETGQPVFNDLAPLEREVYIHQAQYALDQLYRKGIIE